MRKILIVLLLGGCVTSKPVSLPDGQVGHIISCDGGVQDISACMNKAAELCGGAYNVISQDQYMIGTTSVVYGNTATATGAIERKLVVACD